MPRSHRFPLRRPLALVLLLAATATNAASVLIEGELQEFGLPAEGRYDLQLQPYADADSAKALSSATELLGVEVHNGRFRVDLDLPDGLQGDPAIAVAVRAHGETGGYALLPARVQAKAGPIGVCWSTTGDEGVVPGTHFLGTTDLQPLELRVGNTTGFRVLPTGVNTTSTPNILGGYEGNSVTGVGVAGVTIAGGGGNISGSDQPHAVTAGYASIGGGVSNAISGSFGTIAGGSNNSVTGPNGTIGGGDGNRAAGTSAAVAGGEFNLASGARSVVAGGSLNNASGQRSSVIGGLSNCAGGSTSLAGGARAKVRPGSASGELSNACSNVALAPTADGDRGTFVWADSQEADFVSSGSNQFLVRALGGVALNRNVIPAGIDLVVGSREANATSDLLLTSSGATDGINLRAGGGALTIARAQLNGAQSPNVTPYALWGSNGQFQLAVDNPTKPTAGGFAAASDARLKTAIRPLDGALESLLKLEGVRFRYREGAPTGFYAPGEQTGFIAQQVEQVFPDWVVEHPSGYKLVGSKGFDALTVEALRELRTEKDAEIADLREQNALLAARLARIEEALQRSARP